jgi:hypothetical protein
VLDAVFIGQVVAYFMLQQDAVNLLKKRPYDGRTDTHMKTPNLGDFT